jgi:hypothetical protein
MTSAEFRGKEAGCNCATIEHLADCNKDSILIEPLIVIPGAHLESIPELINGSYLFRFSGKGYQQTFEILRTVFAILMSGSILLVLQIIKKSVLYCCFF